MIGRFSGDGEGRALVAGVGQPDGAQVGVLDRPSVFLDCGHGHAEGVAVAFPGYDDGRDAPLAAGVLLDGPRDRLWRSGDSEGENFTHLACYTGPVVEPV